jgi:hypothetical protein
MREPMYSEETTKVWSTPRLIRLGTISDVAGSTPPTNNQTAASKT